MSALEIIEQIKELPANEQVRVAKFIAENGSSMTRHQFSVGTENDGLPVIHANGGPVHHSFSEGGTITSQLVHEIESLTTVGSEGVRPGVDLNNSAALLSVMEQGA